jgi:hypothetical protein
MMPKAILELEMPESCWECRLRVPHDEDSYDYCAGMLEIYQCPLYGKRKDCPLKLVEEKVGCEECNGVAGMELPLSAGIQKVNYCPMCGRKLGDE